MLLNVRLTEVEARAVRGLRRAKVNVSELVRRALREAAAKEKDVKVKHSVVLGEIIEAFPGPSGATTRRPPLDDRRALSKFIQKKLTRQ